MSELFAGLHVSDYEAARRWYERVLGAGPTFEPHETECVWELGEHSYVYIVEDARRAGHGVVTLFVDDLDTLVQGISSRGVEPAERETYANGVRKVTYRDADGNEVAYGAAPA